MSLGEAVRGLIDPIHPAVREWLQRELPRLVQDGFIQPAQANAIARRYGVTVSAPAASPRANQEASAPASAGGAPGAPPPIPAGLAAPPSAGPAAPSAAPPPTRPAAAPFLADHAVSIVLYLGAFLVVAAVVIFLAYSWGDISAGAKLAVLALLTLGFLGAAGLCLPRPSVRPAGRTFLALGAILVPANIAAIYLVYFEAGPIPGAVFWLLGALISGGLHAVLSLRLNSKAYGVLATLAVPVAASALGWLIASLQSPRDHEWVIGPASAVGLVLALAAARSRPPVPLVRAARAVASLLLPLAYLTSLPFLGEDGLEQYGTPAALLLMTLGLAWEATRGGKTWWIGAVALLLAALPNAIALAAVDDRPLFVTGLVISGLIAALAARRLQPGHRLLWDIAAILPALVYPFAAWGDDRACLELFAGLALISILISRGWRSSLPLYAAVLAVDGSYIKLLEIYGSPDSPDWMLGVALWALGVVWALLGAVLPRRISGPGWLGALITLLAASLAAWEHAGWTAAIAATGAIATVLAAWRLGIGPVLLLAVPWLLLAGFRAADALDLALHWRFVVAGLTGWLLLVVSMLRPPTTSILATPPATPAPPAPSMPSAPSAPAAPSAPSASALPPAQPAPAGATGGRPRIPLGTSPAAQWPLMARVGAAGVAGLAGLLLLAGVFEGDDPWLRAIAVGWLNVALVLAAWAVLARSRDLAVVSALCVVPALLSGIGLLHPTDGQAYALPTGLYLLALAAVTLQDRRKGRAAAANAIAALGLLVLLGTGVVQSLDRDRFAHALLTLAEGLTLVGVGIAIRWRVLVVGGVAGTVVIAVRQLFDAVAALPGWAILGGSGLLLLAIAVVLLLARARLAAAGRSVAEHWSNWN